MGRMDVVFAGVRELPRADFLKLAGLIARRATLLSFEKTAEVSTKLVDREREILEFFYKETAALIIPGADGHTKTAAAMIDIGIALLQANDLRADPRDCASVLEKLATTGVVNGEIAAILANPLLSAAGREQAHKLAAENNAHTLDLLTALTKTANSLMGYGSKLLGGARTTTGAASSTIANSFKAPASSGGFMSTAKNFLTGGGNLGKTIGSGASKAIGSGGISTSSVASGFRGASGGTK